VKSQTSGADAVDFARDAGGRLGENEIEVGREGRIN